jgi:hypothetical protein
MLGNAGDKPDKVDTEKHKVSKSTLHQNKLKQKQDTTAGRTLVAATMTSSEHLVPWDVVGVIGLFYAL